ncbi:BadF/BadG/BcrA/BcrD ATPase family protein [Collinsella vaginalis]|uniref:BadF/BadG/BcrA/BcrD ATPase family protein n=1 Tax=Collinsella vaginalis TaxID=1870987 RepID=UPI000A2693DE|nr:BadF/BadG/BcrA/BcrD ATPase family protein [Collinsella vaginalis]
MFHLGIDGGGTKTACTLFRFEGSSPVPLDSITLPTCHYAQVGLEGMKSVLAEALTWAQNVAGDEPLGIAFGICGYGEGAESTRAIDRICAEIAGDSPFIVVNDVEVAWAAGLGLAAGIVLIAGTGSIAYGVCAGRSMRCGGWDYLLGDEGSGGWLGKEALYAYARQADGRATRGPLFDLVNEELGFTDPFELIAFANTHFSERGAISALAPLVTAAATAGDPSAQEILKRAAEEEAGLITTIACSIFPDDGSKIPVSYVGGTFKAGAFILDPLRQALPARFRITPPLWSPEAGAALLLERSIREL